MGSDLQHIALTYQLASIQVIYDMFTCELAPDGTRVDEIGSTQHVTLAIDRQKKSR